MEALDFSKLIKKAWLIALVMVIGAGTAFLYGITQPTEYQVQARLLVGPGIDSLRPDLNVLRASGQLIQTYAEMPLTEPFLQEVIAELQLQMQPEDLAQIISVRPNPETQILSIEVRYPKPDQAQAIAYLIADKLVRLSPSNPDSSAAQMKGQIQSQVVELEQSVAQTRTSLAQLETDYQAALENERMLRESAGSNEAISKQLEEFETNTEVIADAASQREVGIGILEELVSNTNARILQFDYELKNTTNAITQKLVSEQIRQERNHLSDLRQAIAEINSHYEGMPLDQYILTTTQQLVALEESLTKIVNFDNRRLQFDQINQLQTRLSQARAEEASRQQMILNRIGRERERISDVSLSRIENQRQILEQITEERSQLSEMQNTLALLYSTTQAADPNQVKVIELAKPIRMAPPISLMVLVGAMAGGVLAAVGVLASSYLTKTIDGEEQVARLMNAAVIDMGKGITPLQSREYIQTRLQETYQMLGMRLLYSQAGGDNKVILVGSADLHSDAGIVASNLAVFLAKTGKRVLLVDANMDSPTIAGHFRLEQQEGVSDYLTGSIKTHPHIATVDQYPLLGLVPYGGAFLDSAYLNSDLLCAQLEALKSKVDFLLVSVPGLLRPDSLALAANADGVVVVAAKDKTKQNTLEEVAENLKLVGAKILSVVLKSNPIAGESIDWPTPSPEPVSHLDSGEYPERLPSRSQTNSDNSDSGESFSTPVAS